MSIESPESKAPRSYENQEPITDIEEALQLIGQHKKNNIEVHIIDSDEGLRISMTEVSGWPEEIGAIKNYHLSEAVFEELKEKKHIQRMDQTSWVSTSY